MKALKTNSKEVREQIKKHILECVYDYKEETFSTFEGAARHLYFEFNRVANHPNNLKRIPNNQERFQDYLMGIPFHFEYEEHKMADFLNSLGINPEGKEYSNIEVNKRYCYLIFSEMMKVINK